MRRIASRWMALGLLALAGSACAQPQPDASSWGGRLFKGEQALSGRLAGHAAALPAAAVRCINCHSLPAAPGNATTFAPRLAPPDLLQLRARRGGPPSRYDATAFCRLLRDGVDPASVMIDITMPRYTLSAADCQALWAHLTSP